MWQVFMKFSAPWWTFSREEGNRAVPILFGNFTAGIKAGATGITDNKMAQVTSLKGTVTQDFRLQVFSCSIFHGPLNIALSSVRKDYSQSGSITVEE
jgi:hypothetical protein